jgi:hypothetical protein
MTPCVGASLNHYLDMDWFKEAYRRRRTTRKRSWNVETDQAYLPPSIGKTTMGGKMHLFPNWPSTTERIFILFLVWFSPKDNLFNKT